VRYTRGTPSEVHPRYIPGIYTTVREIPGIYTTVREIPGMVGIVYPGIPWWA